MMPTISSPATLDLGPIAAKINFHRLLLKSSGPEWRNWQTR
jgi:hypothetical protein